MNKLEIGSTATTVLTYHILKESQKYLSAGCSLLELKRGMEEAINLVIDNLDKTSKKIKSIEDIEKVATISANNDPNIGKLIAKAIDLVGRDGYVVIKEGKSIQTVLDLVEGFRLNSGYLSGQFITNEKKQVMEYSDPLFFITDHIIETVQEILPVLELAARDKNPLIIIAGEVKGQALAGLIANTLRGSMKVAALTVPSFGDERKNILQDLCVATGAKFITKESYRDFKSIKLIDFGKAKSIEANKNYTIITRWDGTTIFD